MLYWHTLSAAEPFAALLAQAPPLGEVPPKVRALMRPQGEPAAPPEA